ncbi:MAG TPA: HPr-rel-A system PqqD family peptide chaperone [Solirubrobacteraceae bacterium]
MKDLPSRTDHLELADVADGFVVYHPERDRVHFFNHTAAVVLELCDGTRRDTEIADMLQRAYELPDPPEAEVAECLAQLREEGLIR